MAVTSWGLVYCMPPLIISHFKVKNSNENKVVAEDSEILFHTTLFFAWVASEMQLKYCNLFLSTRSQIVGLLRGHIFPLDAWPWMLMPSY